ncbi:hypothetical protein MK079_05485 [Candidatus Gracilibacteria bacterium]|nr:hypothetical protein [Candidatus Gracilibacteria bacterium]
MQDHKQVNTMVQHLKETGASFEDIQSFQRGVDQLEAGEYLSLESSKNTFLKHRKKSHNTDVKQYV